MNADRLYDTDWEEISASLRKGILYVKMPRAKLLKLALALEACGGDLALKDVQMVGNGNRSMIISNPVDDWQVDMDNANLTGDSPEVLREFTEAVLKGLAGDPGVDWIARMQATPESPYL